MIYKEIPLRCSRCGTAFNFSAEKQEFLHAWGLTQDHPSLCPDCSLSEKSELRVPVRPVGSLSRRSFTARCADCGKNTEVPFKPRPGRRIFCVDCFKKIRSSRY